MSTLYLVRHGQAGEDLFNYDDLTALGERQLTRLGRFYRSRLEGAAFSAGRLRRHQLSASAFLAGAGQVAPVAEEPRFDEFDFLDIVSNYHSDWSDPARLHAELAGRTDPGRYFLGMFRDALRHWVSEPREHDFIETWPDFRGRVAAALADLDDGRDHWVFTSGGVIAALVSLVLDAGGEQAVRLNLGIANASVTTLDRGRGDWRLQSFNQTQYLLDEPELLTYR